MCMCEGIHSHDTKRNLNWINGKIVNRNNPSDQIQVRYLKPYVSNPTLNDNEVYMGFTVYDRSSNIGTFYFVDVDTAIRLRSNCPEWPSNHAGAYYHVFRRCPTDTDPSLTSGFCYDNGRLVYNSYTFNKKLNNVFYRNLEDKRDMHPDEQNMLNKCFNDWKANNFKNDPWKCDVSAASGRRRRNAVPVCSTCSCDISPVGGSFRKRVNIFLIILSLAVGSSQLIPNLTC